MIAGRYDAHSEVQAAVSDLMNREGSEISDEVILKFLGVLTNIIDEQIEKRFRREDIMQFYNARITKLLSDSTSGQSVEAELDGQYITAVNASGIAFFENDIGKYVKIGTCDHVNYAVLYKLAPDTVDINEIKTEIQKIKDELSKIKNKK